MNGTIHLACADNGIMCLCEKMFKHGRTLMIFKQCHLVHVFQNSDRNDTSYVFALFLLSLSTYH